MKYHEEVVRNDEIQSVGQFPICGAPMLCNPNTRQQTTDIDTITDNMTVRLGTLKMKGPNVVNLDETNLSAY